MHPPAPLRLTLLLPVYDESPRIEASLATLVSRAEEHGEPFEVLCVDDGSRDDSLARMRSFAARDRRVVVVACERNRGKGAAIREGFLRARGERVVFMDVDLSTDLDALEPVLAALDGGADVVLGSRHDHAARIERRQPVLRESLGRCFRRGVGAVFARGDFDFTCGFKGFRLAAARSIAERMTIERWTFDVEIVVIARALGLQVAQVPVVWRHEGASKVRVAHAVVTSLRDLVRIALRRAAGRYR